MADVLQSWTRFEEVFQVLGVADGRRSELQAQDAKNRDWLKDQLARTRAKFFPNLPSMEDFDDEDEESKKRTLPKRGAKPPLPPAPHAVVPAVLPTPAPNVVVEEQKPIALAEAVEEQNADTPQSAEDWPFDLYALRVVDLKQELRNRGYSDRGLKKDLQLRLIEALKVEKASRQAAAPAVVEPEPVAEPTQPVVSAPATPPAKAEADVQEDISMEVDQAPVVSVDVATELSVAHTPPRALPEPQLVIPSFQPEAAFMSPSARVHVESTVTKPTISRQELQKEQLVELEANRLRQEARSRARSRVASINSTPAPSARASVDLAEQQAQEARLAAEETAARVEAERQEALRKEAARLEAVRVEAARVEAERQEALRKEAARVEALRQETERQEAARLEAARQEAARLEAARQEAARKELERQEAARLEAARLEAARLEAARQEAARQEAARQEAARQEAARQEAARLDAARQEAARLEAVRLESARQEAARKEAERQEAARLEAARLEAARLEAARVEAARLEAARQEAARQEAARQEAARQEAARQEAARQEAARQEAARQEAARQEAARQETARQEAARQETARLEAARQEAARLEAARLETLKQQEAENLAKQRAELRLESAALRVDMAGAGFVSPQKTTGGAAGGAAAAGGGKRPEDNYDLSPCEDYHSPAESDPEEENERRKKRVPDWAQGEELQKLIHRQFNDKAMDPDLIFPFSAPNCDLSQIFAGNAKKKRYEERGESGNWKSDRLTTRENDTYKRAMGFGKP